MLLADVNVLIYAFRADSPFHPACKSWLDRTVSSDAPFGLSPLALSAVVRIVTTRTLVDPNTLEEAFGYCENLLGQPNAVVVEPGPGHWEIFRRLCTETDTRGRKVSDVWYAALAIEHGCTFVTYDRDFARFPGLPVVQPQG